MLSKRNGYLLLSLIILVVGFAFLKAPTPHIAIAAEEIVDLGGYSITNTILSAWVVIILMAIPTLLLYRRLRRVESALVPRGFQNLLEALIEAFYNIVELVAGEKNARRFFPVVASIFLFLLIGNWFGLFPWNNVIGVTEDERALWLEELEENAEELFHEIHQGHEQVISIAALNQAFANVATEPIPVEASHQAEADQHIAALLTGEVGSQDAAVRAQFADHPIPADTTPADLEHAIEERLLAAGLPEAAIEHYLVFNLPLAVTDVGDTELNGAILNAGGVDIIPLRAKDFEFDPFVDPIVADVGGYSDARIFTPTHETSTENRPAAAGEITLPITVNTAHVGVVLKRAQEGLEDGEGIGLIFPFFRSIATDINLPLAIALWAFIWVQWWGIRSLGLGTNFGRFIGVGDAALVKGPVGLMVGILEIISEVARIVSFTFRLFGNIFAGEILLFMAAFLVPFLVATVFYGLEVFVSVIQAFVFAMLTLVFAVTAVSHGAHDDEEHERESAAH
ncbi:MAG: F0F1 ATP synthase subunit A [Chloroflexi bacterium]|nr:F0F1 ATP synthase subunit A [Chloroflexota bacterium]